MLTMIIADDEPVILRGLEHFLDWQELGIRVSGTYSEGSSAMAAVLEQQPSLALLDINMPGLDGIGILRNIHDMELPTKVIFISGFQDFSYARNALRYGAQAYLLKPVVKEELLDAILKAEESFGEEERKEADNTAPQKAHEEIREQRKTENTPPSCYLPVLTELILPDGTSPRQGRLLRFAYLSFLQQAVVSPGGSVYTKGSDTMIVLYGVTLEMAEDALTKLCRKAAGAVRGIPAFILADPMPDLSDLSAAWKELLGRKEEFYFVGSEEEAIIYPKKAGSAKEEGISLDSLSRARERLLDAMIAQDQEGFQKAWEQFSRLLGRAAMGRREDACYYYCSSVRSAADRLQAMKIRIENPDAHALLEMAGEQKSYRQLTEMFRKIFQEYYDSIKNNARSAGEKDITSIKAYIDQHYRESLSLEVMAKTFFMNSYYFSSYFKKQTGTNFKDFLADVRIQHALSLLLTTDMKTYEIAAEVGFSDARAFSDAFTKRYHETPSAYRKRVGGREG